MKRLIMYFFATTLLASHSLFAQPTKYLKLGVNYSFFRTEGGKSEPGLAFGVDKDFYPIRSFNGFFGFELGYAIKKFKLQNKTWPTDFYQPELSDVMIGDIPLDRSYIEFHTKIGYNFPGFRNKVAITLFGGPFFSFPIKYLQRFVADTTIELSPDEKGKYKFDYLRCESDGVDRILNWFVGIAVFYKSIGIDICYNRGSRTGCIRGLTIDDALDSFSAMFLYVF